MIGKIALTAVALAVGTTMAKTQPEAETIAKEWRLLGRDIVHRAENCPLARDRNTPLPFTPPEAECADRQALVWETDRDPLDIVLRRTRALADDIACPKECSDALDALAAAAAKTDVQDADARFTLFVKVVRLRRKIAFANPLVKGIDKLLFVGREAFPPDEYNWGVHMCDQFFGFHATQKAASRGDGLYVLEGPFTDAPKVRNLLAGKTIRSKSPYWNGRRLQMKMLHTGPHPGGYLAPDLLLDARQARNPRMERGDLLAHHEVQGRRK